MGIRRNRHKKEAGKMKSMEITAVGSVVLKLYLSAHIYFYLLLDNAFDLFAASSMICSGLPIG